MTNETDVALEALDQLVPPHLRTSRHGENFMGARYELIRAALSARPAPECKDCGDSITAHDPGICGNCYAMKRPLPQATLSEDLEPAPPNSLPTWNECALRVNNSEYIAKRVAEGGYGPEPDSLLASELHRFIYEYDDADSYRSAWFMHRLELLLNEHARAVLAASRQVPVGWQPIETAPKDGRTLLLGHFNSYGHWRTLRGQWFSADVIAETWENPECEEGWYETSVECEDDVNCWATDPTHWQPLPASPSPVGQEEPGHKCGEGVGIVGVEGRKP